MIAEKLFAQSTTFTCGPSVCASALKLIDPKTLADEATLAREFESRALAGTCHERILNWALMSLPVTSFGEGTYNGGLAIANIRNPVSGNGHFVLMLGRQQGRLEFYCPYLDQTVTIHEEVLDWSNGTGTLSNWVINLRSPA